MVPSHIILLHRDSRQLATVPDALHPAITHSLHTHQQVKQPLNSSTEPRVPDHNRTPRSAQTANMAPSRTRNVDSDGPSTADVSASEDVEMKDAEERVDGFNKFGVRACLPSIAVRLLWRERCAATRI